MDVSLLRSLVLSAIAADDTTGADNGRETALVVADKSKNNCQKSSNESINSMMMQKHENERGFASRQKIKFANLFHYLNSHFDKFTWQTKVKRLCSLLFLGRKIKTNK